MFPVKLGLFPHDLSLGLVKIMQLPNYGKNPGIGQKYFPSFSKLHLDAGGLTGWRGAAAPGPLGCSPCWMRAMFRNQGNSGTL